MSVVKKKKHVSKKNKKDWRKHSDIRDVEDFLEDQRLEERLGKFDTKPDSELFVVDTGAEDKNEVEEKPLTAKQRKRLLLPQTPKCFEVLLPSSKVQDPNAKRNKVNPIGSRPTALSKLTEKRKQTRGVFEKKLEMAKKNRKMAIDQRRRMKKSRENFNLNLWGDDLPESKVIPETLTDDFVSPAAQLHNVLPTRRLRKRPGSMPAHAAKPAVPPPHPGVSYNPSYQEHQELLRSVVEHESKMMRKEQKLVRATSHMFRKVTPKEKEEQWKAEMSAGLPSSNSEPKEDSESDSEYKAINPPVRNKKKDHKARRKQKERLEELERKKREKIDKKKISDIYRLRKLESSITNKEKKQAAEREARAVKRTAKAAEALPSLSAHKTPKPEPEFVDPAALSGDLRHIDAKANLLRDRYESLQRRGVIAASKIMMKKKRRVKQYFKPGHKVTDQDIQKYLAKGEKVNVK